MSGSGPPATGVLVMAHGTPGTPEEIEPFYTSIRRGRPPTPELLADLVRRYDAIGGISPLAERTRRQVDGLAATLERSSPGRYLVRYGAKHTSPRIEDGVAALQAERVSRIVGIVLTPHQSSLGSGEYLRRAAEAAAASDPPSDFVGIPSWHRAPGLAELLAARTTDALSELTADQRRHTTVFFTAHSLPEKVLTEGDPYADQVHQSASDIAARLGLVPGLMPGPGPGPGPGPDTESGSGSSRSTGSTRRPDTEWGVAWQSAGRTGDPWIGPDLLSEIRRVAENGATSVVVCPVGFVSDHLEILFDLDIEAAGVAGSVGVAFARTSSLNDDPGFLDVLAGAVGTAATVPIPR